MNVNEETLTVEHPLAMLLPDTPMGPGQTNYR